jgi:hypothetical protein
VTARRSVLLVLAIASAGLAVAIAFGVSDASKKRPVRIIGADAQNKVYDGTTKATVDFSGATLSGIVSSDDVELDSSGSSAQFDNAKVGSGKTVTITGVALSGPDAGSYMLIPPRGTATISAKHLTITAQTDSKVYASTITFTGP